MYSGPLSPPLSRACLFSLCLIVSSVVSCHTETVHLPRAELRVKVHLAPVDQAWLTAYEPSLMLSAAGGPPVTIELSERHLDEASGDVAELVFAGAWRGDVTFTLSHLMLRGGRRRVSHQVTLEGSTRRSYQAEALLADTHNAQNYDHEVWLEPVNFVGIGDISWTRSLNISDHEWWSTPSQRVDQDQVHSALRGAWSHLVHAEIRRGQERGSHEGEASSIEDSWSMLVAINTHLSEMSPEEADPMLVEWGRALQDHARDHLDGARLTTAAYHLLRALPCSLLSLAEKGRESEAEVGEECRRERDREVYISVSEGSPRRGAGGELIEDLIVETISLSDRVTSSLKVTWIDALGDEHDLYDRERLEFDTASSDSGEYPRPDAYSTVSHRGDLFVTPERRERVSILWRDVNRPRVRLKVIAIDEARKRSTLEVSRALHDTPQVSLRGLASIVDSVDVGALRAAPLEEVIASEILRASSPPLGAEREVNFIASPTLFTTGGALPDTLWEGRVAEGRYQLDHSGYLGPLWVEVSAERDSGPVTFPLIADPSRSLSPRVLHDLERPEHKLTINAWSSPMSQLGVWLAIRATLSGLDPSQATDHQDPQGDERAGQRVETEGIRRATRALARRAHQVQRRLSHINGAPIAWFERGELQGDSQSHLWLQTLSARDQVAECLRYGAPLLEAQPDDLPPLSELVPWSSLIDVESVDDAGVSWAVDQWALFMMSACHRAAVARGEPLKLTSLLTAGLSSDLAGDGSEWARALKSEHWVTAPQGVWAYDEDQRVWKVREPDISLHINAPRGAGVIALSEFSAIELPRDQAHHAIRSAELTSTEDSAFSEIFTPPQRFVGRCLWGEESGGSRELNQHEVTWGSGAWIELPLSDVSALHTLEHTPAVNVEPTDQRAWVWGIVEQSEEREALDRLALPLPCDATLRLTLDSERLTHDWNISTFLWGQHQPYEPRSSLGSPASAALHALADLTERVDQRVRVELDQAPPHLLFSEATLGDDTLDRPDLNSRLLAEIGVDVSLNSVVGVVTQDHLSDADDQEAHAYPHYFLKRITPRDGSARVSWVTDEPSRCYAVTQLEDLEQHSFNLSSAELIRSLPTLELLSRPGWRSLYQRDLSEVTPLGDSTDLSVFTRAPSTRDISEGIHREQIRGYTSWSIDVVLPALLDGTYSLYAGCVDSLGHETITPLAVTVDGEAPQVHSLTLSGIDERVLSYDGVSALPSAEAEDLTRTVNLLSDADTTIAGEPLVAEWHRTSAHWRRCLGTCAVRPLLLSVEASDSQWSHRALTATLTGRLSVARGEGEPRVITEISPLRVYFDESGRAEMNMYGLIQRALTDERAHLIPRLGETLTFQGLATVRDPLKNQRSFALKLDLHSIPPAVEVVYTPPLEEIGAGINVGRWGPLYQGGLGTLTVRNPHDENLSVRLIPPLLHWGSRYGVRDFGVTGGEVYHQRVADTCLMTASGLAPRLGVALTDFSSSLDPHDGVCVQLPSIPTLVDDHVTLELTSEDQLIPARAFRELPQPYILDAAPDALVDHVAPPDEEMTPQLPSTARVEVLERPGYYMSPFHSSCDGPCTPQTLILGQRITSLMWLSLTESVDEEEINPILAQYPLATAERFEQYMWYISVTSPDPEIRSTLTPLLIPLSYPTLESEYHAEALP